MAVEYSQRSSPEREPVCDRLGPAAATSQTDLKDLLNSYLQSTALCSSLSLQSSFLGEPGFSP